MMLAGCTAMTDDTISHEEWDELGSIEWVDVLAREWSKPFVSLSAVVHWIATRGELREADYDELNEAAKYLVSALHDHQNRLIPHGISSRDGSLHEEIPPAHTSNIPSFFDDGRETAAFGIKPYLKWNPFLEDGNGDVIKDRGNRPGTSSDTIHWRDISIDKADMLRLWPAKHEPPTADKVSEADRESSHQVAPIEASQSQRPSAERDSPRLVPLIAWMLDNRDKLDQPNNRRLMRLAKDDGLRFSPRLFFTAKKKAKEALQS
jgi:hypothetical protein